MSLAEKISAFNRKRKWKLFLNRIRPIPATTILDVGFTEKEHSSVDNFIERFYPFPENITALGMEEPVTFSKRYPKVKALRYDGVSFPFPDKSFDVCWSNAVIEHVGNREAQLLFLQEIVRVSRRAFVTTPNRYFPIELHTRTPLLHWLPKDAFDAFLRRTGREWATGTYMDLLSEGQLRGLLNRSGAKYYEIYSNCVGGFAMDFAAYIHC